MQSPITSIKNRYYLKGTIRLTSALHIGGGQVRDLETQAPLVKTPAGQPFIPGSSLKGIFRSFIDKIIPAIDLPFTTCQLNDNYKNCYSVGDGHKKFVEWKKNKNFTEDALYRELDGNLCSVCKVFGSPWKAAGISFTDAHITDWAEVTQLRHGVVIDRDSEKTVGKGKYDYEVIPAGSCFAFSLFMENLSDEELSLVAVGLNEMLAGLMQLGGKTSRGAGNFILETPELYATDFYNQEQLKKYLRNRTPEEKMSCEADAAGFLQTKINQLWPEEK